MWDCQAVETIDRLQARIWLCPSATPARFSVKETAEKLVVRELCLAVAVLSSS